MHKPRRSARLLLALGVMAAVVLIPTAGIVFGQPDAGRRDGAGGGLHLPPPVLDLPDVVGPPQVRPEVVNRLESAVLRAASPNDEDPFATIDTCITKEMKAEGAPGAAIAIMKDGRLIYTKGYGVKNTTTHAPVDPATQFRIGSITKMFTAAAVMQQVEAGKVDLHAPITRYIPEYRVAEDGATDRIAVWNLLTHSSGLPDNAFLDGNFDGAKTDQALSNWVTTQITTHIHAPAGTLWNYSNPNFMLAGLVAERASGIPYHTYMPAHIFATAGLSNTTLLPSDVVARGDYTDGYWTNPYTAKPEVLAPDSYDRWDVAPAGYAFSTVGDLATWAQLLMDGGGHVITPASAAAMQARQQTQHTVPDQDYGFGVFAEKYKGLDVRQHGGNVPGWGGYLLWVPSEHFVVATLDNEYPATMNGTAYCAIDALLHPADVPPPNYSTPPDTWGKYVGKYAGWVVNGQFLRANVTQQNGMTLTLTLPDYPVDAQGTPFSTTLYQAALDVFVFDQNGDGKPDVDVTFIQDPTDPTIWWMRNRQWVLRRPLLPGPTPTPTTAPPTATPGHEGSSIYLPRLFNASEGP
jgi:CubicO group peptidase (beta-lactamase class C family)